MNIEKIAENKSFGGQQLRFSHSSSRCNCEMTFSIYLPTKAETKKVPALYWLSGLTCTDENFVTKAGAQLHAETHGLALIAPDTSPRGSGVPDDPNGDYDFGLGAGFYVNATEPPYNTHYHMYDYIVDELPNLINENFNIEADRTGILGHSMGGHGALTIAFNNPGRYKSISAFSPISSPINCPWGQKALTGYLGPDQANWQKHDASVMISKTSERLPLLIDQGDKDPFLEEQLKPEILAKAAKENNHPINLRMHPGYDHSYFFIASFIGDHIMHHANALK